MVSINLPKCLWCLFTYLNGYGVDLSTKMSMVSIFLPRCLPLMPVNICKQFRFHWEPYRPSRSSTPRYSWAELICRSLRSSFRRWVTLCRCCWTDTIKLFLLQQMLMVMVSVVHFKNIAILWWIIQVRFLDQKPGPNPKNTIWRVTFIRR